MVHLQHLEPERNYFPEPAKSIYVYHPEDWLGAKERLEAFGFKLVDGSRYVGGFLGSEATLSEWLKPHIAQWVRALSRS
jgi:hypothetical protein